jgi:acetyl-CoA carboxylase biotin carboxyl carrier protein
LEKNNVNEFLKIFNENSLDELYYKNEDFEIKIKRETAHVEEQKPVIIRKIQQEKVLPVKNTKPEVKEKSNFKEIKSPIHGNFYRSPSPNSRPFVETGDKVTEGQVVCIIESMKVMNEIKSTVSGKVVDILVDNGTAVLKDQPLILVE